MRSEGKKRTLELSLIQGFSKIEKLFGGATSNIKVKSQSIRLNRTLFKSADYQSFWIGLNIDDCNRIVIL